MCTRVLICACTACSKPQASSVGGQTPDGGELVSLSLLPPQADTGMQRVDLSQLRFLLRRLTTHDGATHTVARELTCHELSFPYQNPLLDNFPPVVLEAMLQRPRSAALESVQIPAQEKFDPEMSMAAVRHVAYSA